MMSNVWLKKSAVQTAYVLASYHLSRSFSYKISMIQTYTLFLVSPTRVSKCGQWELNLPAFSIFKYFFLIKKHWLGSMVYMAYSKCGKLSKKISLRAWIKCFVTKFKKLNQLFMLNVSEFLVEASHFLGWNPQS